MNDLFQNEGIQKNGNNIDDVSYGNKIADEQLGCATCHMHVDCDDVNDEGQSVDMNESYNSRQINNENVIKKDKRTKIIFGSVLGFIFIVIAVFICVFLMTRVIPLEIDEVSGCPEFYNLEWNMTAREVDKQVELEHNFTPFSPEEKIKLLDETIINAISGKDVKPPIKGEDRFYIIPAIEAELSIKEGETFYVYGKKADNIQIDFDGNFLESVQIFFAKDEYSFAEIVELYTKIYGKPTQIDKDYVAWIGNSTVIDVLDYSSDNGFETISVMYRKGNRLKYPVLKFDGPEIDPCSFLSNNYIFDKVPYYYIDGLEESVDYDKQELSVDGFLEISQYTLYPLFEYMGIDAGMTAIEFTQNADGEAIEMVSYKFVLDKGNAVDRMRYMYLRLFETYGVANDICYTSTNYAKIGLKNLTLEEMMQQIFENTEGIYNIQWKQGNRNITLTLTISVDKEYYEGSVTFTD